MYSFAYNNSSIVHNDTEEAVVDIVAYLEQTMGEKRRDMVSVAFLTFVYLLIFITGISGNVCTCIVIARNAYMHTATNYYLFNLAMSDMLTLLFGLPTELYSIWEAYPWPFGEPFCILKSFVAEMTSYASVMTITAFTVERYVAICHPIKAQTLSNLSRAIKMVFIIWICSCVIALPYPVHTRVFPYVYVNGTGILDSLQCNIPLHWHKRMFYAFQVSTFLFFVFPMAVITIMYALIGIKLSRSHLDIKHKPKAKARQAVIRMLVAVVVAFFIQWAPFHAQRLMTSYISPSEWTPVLLKFQSNLFYVSGVLYYCNSTINPILYNSMSRKFRLAFKKTLCRCCYSSEELQELNCKSKSIYCSERHNFKRKRTNGATKTFFTDISQLRNGNERQEQEIQEELVYKNRGKRTIKCMCSSNVRFSGINTMLVEDNNIIVPSERDNGFGPRAACLRYHSLTNSSLVSFCEIETDSMMEMKSYSCGSSTLNDSKVLSVPQHNTQGSYV